MTEENDVLDNSDKKEVKSPAKCSVILIANKSKTVDFEFCFDESLQELKKLYKLSDECLPLLIDNLPDDQNERNFLSRRISKKLIGKQLVQVN